MTMGAFTTGNALSTMLGYDPTTPGGMATWRDSSVEFLLASVRAPARSGRAPGQPLSRRRPRAEARSSRPVAATAT
jgi:hypothetical protein